MVHDFTIFSLPQHFRFAQFFISPLLKEDTVEREIQAVDSGKVGVLCARMLHCFFCFVLFLFFISTALISYNH